MQGNIYIIIPQKGKFYEITKLNISITITRSCSRVVPVSFPPLAYKAEASVVARLIYNVLNLILGVIIAIITLNIYNFNSK